MLYTEDNEPLYEITDIDDKLIGEIVKHFLDTDTYMGKRCNYMGDFMTMDIETSTINRGTEHSLAFTYSIAVYIADMCLLFRTWKDYLTFIRRLTAKLGMTYKNRLVCYVHNLPYEFQFMRDFMHISEVFATQKRKVVKCLSDGIEYRCSYKLTNMGLARFTSSIPNLKHGKLSGADFDYSKLRTPSTYLYPNELSYIYNDVAGLYEALDYTITHDVYNLATIPLTSTGYIRNDLRYEMAKNPENRKNFLACALDQKLYGLMRTARRGGNTHCNPNWSDMDIEDMESEDMSSAYPADMIQKPFPMTPFYPIPYRRLAQFEEYIEEGYACIIDLTFYDLKVLTTRTIPYIAKGAQCTEFVNITGDNGRVLKAEKLSMVITDIDYKIIKETYKIGRIEVRDCYVSHYDYLPMELRKSLLKQYRDKTTLKDGDPYFYMKIKNKFNANFGCMLTDICQDTVEYKPHSCEPFKLVRANDYSEQLAKYYRSKNSFLSYQHGLWVTAWCRWRLQQAINKLGADMVYCDTDSVKFLSSAVNRQIFDELNTEIDKDIEACGLDCTVEYKGETYTLGHWEPDGEYAWFKSMGAKKYAYIDKKDYKCNPKKYGCGHEEDNPCRFCKDGMCDWKKYQITVAGLSKSKAKEYLYDNGFKELFAPKTRIPIGMSGRTSAKYNDWEGVRKLKMNDGEIIYVGSNMVIEDTTYEFSLTEEYETLLQDRYNEGVMW